MVTMLNQADAIELVSDQLFPAWKKEKDRLDRLDDWYRWRQEPIELPQKATRELRTLAELAKTPWLGLVVTTVAQCMYVDGYRSPRDVRTSLGDEEPSGPWRTWHANDFDNRQIAVHRAALAYGQSFVTVLPGRDDFGEPMSVMRGVSPRKMLAVYADPAEDDWPMYAIRVETAPGNKRSVMVYDEEAVYYLSSDSSGTDVEFIEWREHEAGVTPVVRYANMLDLDGRTDGEIEPFIPLAARINKTAYDRLLVQHFNSWKVRTIAGMVQADNPTEAAQQSLKLSQSDLLVSDDPDTKFGTLEETPLQGFILAEEADVEKLAAVSQTPSSNLTGKMANLSAEALASARAPLTQKVTERQKSFGKSHTQSLRLAAALEGDDTAARDVMARVTWQDMEIRSISQAVDALGKAATMLQIPPQALWSRIPGFTKSDVDEMAQMAADGDPMTQFVNRLDRQDEAA